MAQKPKVMIIDDEVHIIEYVSALVEGMGFAVIGFAQDGNEALTKLEL